jgi:HK97 family phage portal protein
MKLKLPLIGEVHTGEDIASPPTKKKSADVLTGLLDLATFRLSDEKSISSKLLAANTSWVYRNNDVIAKEVSKIEYELYTMGLKDGEIVFNPINSHPLLDLLDKPNMETTKGEWMYTVQSHLKLTGDAFVVKVRNGRQVTGLRLLPPDKITLDLQSPTPTDPTVVKGFIYRDRINGEEVYAYYDPADIIHIKLPNPNNAFRGLGAVEPLAETIDIDNLTTETAKKFFQNGALSNFVLSTDKSMTDEQLKRINAEMRNTYTGVKNAFKTIILSGGVKPVDISYSNKDMQFLDQLEWYRDKIMVGFGNTKASLGIVDDVNRASHESSINAWLSSTVKPDMSVIVNALNENLTVEFGTNLVLGFCNPVPEDRSDDVVEATDLFTNGVISRDEARELLEYEPSDNDVFLTPAGKLEEPTNPDQKPVTDEGDNNEED